MGEFASGWGVAAVYIRGLIYTVFQSNLSSICVISGVCSRMNIQLSPAYLECFFLDSPYGLVGWGVSF